MNKKVLIRTYGCQMNEYDSELITGILTTAGYGVVTDPMDADIVMLNTCAVRENANRRVYGKIHDIRHKHPGRPVIGILGCIATNLKNKLLEDKHLKIDFIAGPDSYKRLPEIIHQACKTHNKIADITFSKIETYEDIVPERVEGVNAWVAVMRGCDNFCTFCVVPYTRGRERSRSVKNILNEVKQIAREGFPQVTLLGQNVNSYHDNSRDFADLLAEASKIEAIKRIRFMSPHPKDFSNKLIDVIANNPKVCKHIHLPLQSGNTRVLALMNRTYTKKGFLDLVDRIREACPDVVLTTDIIVGFPTETDNEFNDTVDVLKKIEFDSAFIFKYSQREGTIAAKKYPDDVPEEKKTARTVLLNELMQQTALKKNQAMISQTCEILIEREGNNRSENGWAGRTNGNKLVLIPDGDYKISQLVNVKITEATPHLLRGIPKS